MYIKTVDGWKSLASTISSSLKNEPRDFSDMFSDLHRKIPEKLEIKLDAIRAGHVASMQAKGYQWN
jgi:hypothetical protein